MHPEVHLAMATTRLLHVTSCLRLSVVVTADFGGRRLRWGVQLLKQITNEVFKSQFGWRSTWRRL
uniref:DUF3778 domain-containing protein n=1 Tax=Oryza barthii TaxID=65489 RepID=A0A0D3GM91_9ORYZ